MNKKIKIIELLNKIANEEELPKKIKYESVFELQDGLYMSVDDNTCRFADYLWCDFSNINDEVEILEDNTEEIEELDEEWTYIEGQVEKTWSKSELELVNKINELVKAVNKLRKGNKK